MVLREWWYESGRASLVLHDRTVSMKALPSRSYIGKTGVFIERCSSGRCSRRTFVNYVINPGYNAFSDEIVEILE